MKPDLGDDERNRVDAFVLAEYAALREEIKWIIDQIDTLERNALILTGAVWAWIATQNWDDAYVMLPLVLSVLFFIKRRSLSFALRGAAKYVLKIEEHFTLPKGIGWEHHLAENRPKHFRVWKLAFWLLLIAINLSMAVFTLCFTP
jgi:hypothetical protein